MTETFCLVDDFCRQFKSFYLNHACRYLRAEFPRLPSYQRVVELTPRYAAKPSSEPCSTN